MESLLHSLIVSPYSSIYSIRDRSKREREKRKKRTAILREREKEVEGVCRIDIDVCINEGREKGGISISVIRENTIPRNCKKKII